ncbi:MAG: hypothetical protein AB7O46_09520 [Xanthobacteraceae bacterium]
MDKIRIAALLSIAAAVFPFAAYATNEMNPQEFFRAETKGEFSSPQAQQRARRAEQLRKLQQQRQERMTQFRQQQQQRLQTRQNRMNVPAQTQRTAATATSINPLASAGLGGSWLASNLGSSRPQGAPGAWCGYAMRMEMVSQGYGDPGPEFNLVSHWCRVGSAAPVGAIGSIFVSRGHVSKVVAGDCPAGTVATISGNATARRVSHMCERVSTAVCSRWPGKVNS